MQRKGQKEKRGKVFGEGICFAEEKKNGEEEGGKYLEKKKKIEERRTRKKLFGERKC